MKLAVAFALQFRLHICAPSSITKLTLRSNPEILAWPGFWKLRMRGFGCRDGMPSEKSAADPFGLRRHRILKREESGCKVMILSADFCSYYSVSVIQPGVYKKQHWRSDRRHKGQSRHSPRRPSQSSGVCPALGAVSSDRRKCKRARIRIAVIILLCL